jgi:hypothetical protein
MYWTPISDDSPAGSPLADPRQLPVVARHQKKLLAEKREVASESR